MEPELNLENFCRFCFKEDVAINIFNKTYSLPLKIMTCVNLEVRPNELPNKICSKCHLELEKFYVFRKKAIFYDQKFRKHFRILKSNKISQVFEDIDEDINEELEITDSVQFISHCEEIALKRDKEKTDEINRMAEETKEHYRKLSDECVSKYENRLKLCEANLKQNIREEESTLLLNDIQEFIKSRNEKLISDESERKEESLNIKCNSKNNSMKNDIIVFVENYQAIPNELEQEMEATEEVEYEIDEYTYNDEDKDSVSETDSYKNDTIHEEADQKQIVVTKSSEAETTTDAVNEIHDKELNELLSEVEMESKLKLKSKVDLKTDIKIYKCDKCTQSFTRISTLNRHESGHKKKGLTCELCKKFFSTASSLKKHLRIHTGEKPFECKVCNRRFNQKEILKRHSYVHNEDAKPFICPHCELAFVQKQVLMDHINIKHSKNPVKPVFECEICAKKFSYASGLSRHRVLHTGITFDCEICGKKFSDKSALKRHIRLTHIGN